MSRKVGYLKLVNSLIQFMKLSEGFSEKKIINLLQTVVLSFTTMIKISIELYVKPNEVKDLSFRSTIEVLV